MKDTADYWLFYFRSPFPVPRSPFPVPRFSNIQSRFHWLSLKEGTGNGGMGMGMGMGNGERGIFKIGNL